MVSITIEPLNTWLGFHSNKIITLFLKKIYYSTTGIPRTVEPMYSFALWNECYMQRIQRRRFM